MNLTPLYIFILILGAVVFYALSASKFREEQIKKTGGRQ